MKDVRLNLEAKEPNLKARRLNSKKSKNPKAAIRLWASNLAMFCPSLVLASIRIRGEKRLI